MQFPQLMILQVKIGNLSLGDHSLGDPTISPRIAQKKGITYASPLKIRATLINKRTGKEVTQDVFLGDIPQMTTSGNIYY